MFFDKPFLYIVAFAFLDIIVSMSLALYNNAFNVAAFPAFIVMFILCGIWYYKTSKSSKANEVFLTKLKKNGIKLTLTNSEAPYSITVYKYDDLLYDEDGNCIYRRGGASRAPKSMSLFKFFHN